MSDLNDFMKARVSYKDIESLFKEISDQVSPESIVLAEGIRPCLKFLILTTLPGADDALCKLITTMEDSCLNQLFPLTSMLSISPEVTQKLLTQNQAVTAVTTRANEYLECVQLLDTGEKIQEALRGLADAFIARDGAEITRIADSVATLPQYELYGTMCTMDMAHMTELAFAISDSFMGARADEETIRGYLTQLQGAATAKDAMEVVEGIRGYLPDTSTFPTDAIRHYVALVEHHMGHTVLPVWRAFEELQELDIRILDQVRAGGKYLEDGKGPCCRHSLQCLLDAALEAETELRQRTALLSGLLPSIMPFLEFFSRPGETREWRAQFKVGCDVIEGWYAEGNAVSHQYDFSDADRAELSDLCRKHSISIAGSVDLGEAIGDGGQGTVYKGTLGGKTVVFKAPEKSNLRLYPPCAMDFLKEARNLADSTSDYIIEFHGLLCLPEGLFITLEYCEAGDVTQYLSLGTKDAGWGWPDLLNIAMQMALGVRSFAIDGHIHRDLKPQNFLVHVDAHHGPVVKVGDLGNLLHFSTQTITNIGTLGFIAPELSDGTSYDSKVDVFSLAMTLWCVFTNTEVPRITSNKGLAVHPMAMPTLIKQGERPGLPHHVPEDIRNLITGMWATDPADRLGIDTVVRELCQICLAHDAVWARETDPATGVTSAIFMDHRTLVLRASDALVRCDMAERSMRFTDVLSLPDPTVCLQLAHDAIPCPLGKDRLEQIIATFQAAHTEELALGLTVQMLFRASEIYTATTPTPVPNPAIVIRFTREAGAMAIVRTTPGDTLPMLQDALKPITGLVARLLPQGKALAAIRKELQRGTPATALAAALTAAEAAGLASVTLDGHTVFPLGDLVLVRDNGRSTEVHNLPFGFTPTKIVTGHSSKFFIGEGQTFAVGDNRYGRLGIGSLARTVPIPSLVTFPPPHNAGPPVVDITPLDNHTFFRLSDGAWAGAGLFGDKALALPRRGTLIDPANRGAARAEFMTLSGVLHARGWNVNGRLGVGVQTNMVHDWLPVPLPAPPTQVVITPHAMIVNTARGAFTAGLNIAGQLGIGEPSSKDTNFSIWRPTRLPLPQGSTVQRLWTSAQTAFIETTDGAIHSAGDNKHGQLMLGHTRTRPIFTPIRRRADSVFLADDITFIVSEGRATCAGSNTFGRLGLGCDRAQAVSPMMVDLPNVTRVVPLAEQTFLQTANGLYASGSNGYGQTGIMGVGTVRSFTRLPIDGTVKHIWNDRKSTIIRTDSETLVCGCNRFNQLQLSSAKQLPLTPITDFPTGDWMTMRARTIVAATPTGLVGRGRNRAGCLGQRSRKPIKGWKQLTFDFIASDLLTDGVVSFFVTNHDEMYVAGEPKGRMLPMARADLGIESGGMMAAMSMEAWGGSKPLRVGRYSKRFNQVAAIAMVDRVIGDLTI